MLEFQKLRVVGWETVIRAIRNQTNFLSKSDSQFCIAGDCKACLDFKVCSDRTIIGTNDKEIMMKLRNAGTGYREFLRMIVVYVDIMAPLYWWKEFMAYNVESMGELRQGYSKLTVMMNYEILADIYQSQKGCKQNEWRVFRQFIERLPYSVLIIGENVRRGSGNSGQTEKGITWVPISEYNREKYDWVLVKCFDGEYECIPEVAELRQDGVWIGKNGKLPFPPKYFFDMQRLEKGGILK